MSIKGSSKKLKIELALPIFIIFTVLATVVRTYQYFNIIEPETGFYSAEDFSIPLLYGLLAVAAVLIFVICYLAKKVPLSTLPEGKNIPLAVAGLVLSLSFFIDAAFQVVAYSLWDITFLSEMSGGMGATTFLFKSGFGIRGLEVIFAIISAIYFLIFSAKYFGSSAKVQNRKILAVMPVFWATLRMVVRFTRTISIVNVSDLLLELFMIAFMMMFFLSFAQFASNVNSRHVVNKIYTYGLAGAMFGIVVSIPRIAVQILKPSLIVFSDVFEVCDLGFAIFALVLCCVMLKMPREDNITLREVEKLKKDREKEEENQAE